MDLNYSKNFALYFDRLRFEKGLTQEQFVEDIISIRQYRRYLNGLSYMSHDIITKFSERLGYRPQHMILEFESEKIHEAKRVNQFYFYVANRGYDEAYKILKDMPLDSIHDPFNKMYYQHAIHGLNYGAGKIGRQELLDLTLSLIQYPEILDRNALSSIEMVVLSSLISNPMFKESNKLIEKLLILADNPNRIHSGHNETMHILVLYRIAEYYGLNKRYRDVISVCDRAIEFDRSQRSYYLLDFLYYYKALAHFFLDEKDLHEENLFKTYATLITDGSPLRYKRMSDLVYGDWKIELHDFAIEYMKKHGTIKEEK